MGIEFYEDDDPRVERVIDLWGREAYVVGKSLEGNVKWVWTVNGEGELTGYHPNSIFPLNGK
jgi:hypothetical protein